MANYRYSKKKNKRPNFNKRPNLTFSSSPNGNSLSYYPYQYQQQTPVYAYAYPHLMRPQQAFAEPLFYMPCLAPDGGYVYVPVAGNSYCAGYNLVPIGPVSSNVELSYVPCKEDKSKIKEEEVVHKMEELELKELKKSDKSDEKIEGKDVENKVVYCYLGAKESFEILNVF